MIGGVFSEQRATASLMEILKRKACVMEDQLISLLLIAVFASSHTLDGRRLARHLDCPPFSPALMTLARVKHAAAEKT